MTTPRLVSELVATPVSLTPRPYANALVRYHHPFTSNQRLKAARQAGWNVFQFPSEMLQGGDLLSDSGTTTLTVEQFAALVQGDEAYGTNWGYPQLLETLSVVFGVNELTWELYLFHQGRAAEHALFSHLGPGKARRLLSNGFFDTTRANVEANGFQAIDIPVQTSSERHFGGNIDLEKLANQLKHHYASIPLVVVTITNNTGGGQPVSLGNLRRTRALCDRYGVSLFLDACRFAENAWFIKRHEAGYADVAIPTIVHELFSLCHGFTISFKKDGLANMGGALMIRTDAPLCKTYPTLLETLRDHQILTEGHPTYGGLSGRDIMTISEGLKTVVRPEYLDGRIGQVAEFGACLDKHSVPVLKPFGGHAIYIDVDRFFEGTGLVREDFGGIVLTGLLLLNGVRLCELGAFAFGRYDLRKRREISPPHNYVRAAVPRNKYELQDLAYVATCVGALYEQRGQFPRAVPVYGREKSLRHFKARFELEER